jgi:hypothetical protein
MGDLDLPPERTWVWIGDASREASGWASIGARTVRQDVRALRHQNPVPKYGVMENPNAPTSNLTMPGEPGRQHEACVR